MNILCSISTRNRYYTTLPTALFSCINQTLSPDKIVIFDDNDEPKDLRENEVYSNLFKIMDLKGISWEVIFGAKKGQHYNHQIANTMGFKWVWRCDDDVFPESNVLENLFKVTTDQVGAVGGSVFTPNWTFDPNDKGSGSIMELDKTNKQWLPINNIETVDHLHCSFLYRAGIVDYNLNLSKIAHREETLFTYQLHLKGYKNLIIPNAVSWHLKSNSGGIRDGVFELYAHDDEIFRQVLDLGDTKLIVLNSGIGDHIVFKSILPEILEKYKNVMLGVCYPEVFEDYPNLKLISIGQADILINSTEQNIYKKMADWNHKGSMQDAYRRLHL